MMDGYGPKDALYWIHYYYHHSFGVGQIGFLWVVRDAIYLEIV